MAVATLTVQETSLAGITPTWAAATAADGFAFLNDGNTYLEIKNVNAVELTATLVTPATVRGVAIENPTVAVAATSGVKRIGPFAPEVFNDASSLVTVTLSAITPFSNITAGAFRVRPI